MQQEFQLNIIPFSFPVEEADFAFYTAKQHGYCIMHKSDLNGAIEGLFDKWDWSSISQFIDYLYQFSRVYWKSESKQKLSVKIKYLERIAAISLHITHDKIPDYNEESLWFL